MGFKWVGVDNITFSDSTVQTTGSAVLEYISHYYDGVSSSAKNPINGGTYEYFARMDKR